MITEDKLAAAQLAQIFGSELLRVDEYTTQQSNMAGPAVRLDPKQILVGNNRNVGSNITPEQKRIMDAVNAEAEMSYPRYDEPSQPVAQPAPAVRQQTINPIGAAPAPQPTQGQNPLDQNQMEFSFPPPGSPGFELFEKINKNLERIARAIENIDSSASKSKSTKE
jgi:hypothetical protein